MKEDHSTGAITDRTGKLKTPLGRACWYSITRSATATAFAVALLTSGAVLPLLSAISHARERDNLDERSEQCKAMPDKTERDACIMEILTRSWNTSTATDKLDGSKTITIAIMTPDKITTFMNNQAQPVMAIACQKNRTKLMINWLDFLGLQSMPVKYRIDEQPIVTEHWEASADGTAVFANNPVALTKKLLGKSEFVVNISSYRGKASTVTFHLAGLENVIKPIRENCKW